MRITIVGCGSVGSELAKAADEMAEVKRIYLVDLVKSLAEDLASKLEKAVVADSVEDELRHCDLVIEAASQEAAKEIGMLTVSRGVDIMLMSVGALVDDEYRQAFFDKAKETAARIYVPSGAIAGADALRASHYDELASVELKTTVGPKSLQDVPYCIENYIDVNKFTEPTVIYDGSARSAVKEFPKNINVAATVALLGIGFDRTRVKIIVDPDTIHNSHEITVKGAFGEMYCQTNNLPSPDNPKTSHLSSLSAISVLKRIIRKQWIGI